MSFIAGSPGRPEESVFVCTPGEEIPISALCDGNMDCKVNGDDETTTLCESKHALLVCAMDNAACTDTQLTVRSHTQTSVCCPIMEAAPTLESALPQSLM